MGSSKKYKIAYIIENKKDCRKVHKSRCEKECKKCPPGPRGVTGATGPSGASGATGPALSSSFIQVYNNGAQTVFGGGNVTFDTTGIALGASHSNTTNTDEVIVHMDGIHSATFTVTPNLLISAGNFGAENYIITIDGVVVPASNFVTFLSIAQSASERAISLTASCLLAIQAEQIVRLQYNNDVA
ncbi:collagen-like triple helix repeat-containing protein [Paenibacillus macquariensis]|uniref:BclA C-terminal domain-containing protein n=1 Tax=Paenibacillus macquariensis TaxID=948756 RepID=A0ABY1JYH9_9BACL|nr:collagen-like protein [Paenibacillus macquariensis]MEC0089107.1 collagen-like protein [Paenibacillus macquariensis]OAB33464.1 hypothetical protein PMSM_15850 [Paenibacillus macquariensis subsp. macquariensis]SIQ98454.1 hypothetical protein SAMN05421578_105353 [Paenibacillus macquariensis]